MSNKVIISLIIRLLCLRTFFHAENNDCISEDEDNNKRNPYLKYRVVLEYDHENELKQGLIPADIYLTVKDKFFTNCLNYDVDELNLNQNCEEFRNLSSFKIIEKVKHANYITLVLQYVFDQNIKITIAIVESDMFKLPYLTSYGNKLFSHNVDGTYK